MARYTDIDLLIEAVEETTWYHISKQGELVEGANSKDDIPLYKHSDIKEVLNNAPTADVVPRSEYDEVVYKLECLLCHATGSRLSKHNYPLRIMESAVTDYLQECYDDEMTEVAREIFDAIYEDCFDQFGYINYDALAELKKKYTEGG